MGIMSQVTVTENSQSGLEFCRRDIKESKTLWNLRIWGKGLGSILSDLGDEVLSWGEVRLSVSYRGLNLDING